MRVQRVDAVALTRTYGRRYALKKASFTLAAGTVTAIIGGNGAGKTTTFNILSGRTQPTGGEVHFDGTPAGHSESRRRACGYLSHASFLYGTLTAEENLRLVAGLYGVDPERAPVVVERVGLSGAADRQVRQFSRGMVQRLALGRLLLADPDIWLLDEPASGLDIPGRRWLTEEVRQLTREGRVVALSSHHRTLVSEVATHAIALRRGRVVYAGPVEGPEHVGRLFAEYIG